MSGIFIDSCDDRPYGPGQTDYEYDKWRQQMDERQIENARALLVAAGVFYGLDEDNLQSAQTLNMNDTWGWATAWGEYVPDEKLVEVMDLFCSYGTCGLLYWVSEQHHQMRSEYEDINRFIDFVRQEEALRKAESSSSKRAYKKITYTLGEENG